MPYVKDNRTHYDTDDIEAGIREMIKAIRAQPKGWQFQRGVKQCFSLRYWSGKQEAWKAAIGGSRYPQLVADTARMRGTNQTALLKVLPLKKAEELLPPLEVLSAAGGQPQLHEEMTAQILATALRLLGAAPSGFSKWRYPGRKKKGSRRRESGHPLVLLARNVVKKGLVVRVRDKVVDPKKRAKRTPEERADYWKKVYEKGAVAKKLSWRLECSVLPALRQYDLAFHETLPQKERAIAAGAEVEEHPSLVEVLRSLADQLEKEGVI